MEKYDMSLKELIFASDTSSKSTFTLNLKDVFKITSDICEALTICEELMIVHNDLKPGMKYLMFLLIYCFYFRKRAFEYHGKRV